MIAFYLHTLVKWLLYFKANDHQCAKCLLLIVCYARLYVYKFHQTHLSAVL
jgi:hypothetical protein